MLSPSRHNSHYSFYVPPAWILRTVHFIHRLQAYYGFHVILTVKKKISSRLHNGDRVLFEGWNWIFYYLLRDDFVSMVNCGRVMRNWRQIADLYYWRILIFCMHWNDCGSRNTIIFTVTVLWIGSLINIVSLPGRDRRIFLLCSSPRPALEPYPALCSKDHGGCFPWGKAAGEPSCVEFRG